MKKITALLMVVLMVVTMIPAMALATSAAATDISQYLSAYGTGCETWDDTGANAEGSRPITQFVFSYHNESVKIGELFGADQMGYAGRSFNKETGEAKKASFSNGKMVLTITDLDGKKTTIDNYVPETTYGSTGVNNGDWIIFRLDTCDKGLLVQQGNSYTIKMDFYVGKTLTATGTISGLGWSAGNTEVSQHVYQNGKPNDTKYDASGKYNKGKGVDVEFARYFGTDEETGMMKPDWEKQGDESNCLLVMIPQSAIVLPSDVGTGAMKAKIDLGNGTTLNGELHSNYNFTNDEGTGNWLLRIKTDKVPAAGTLYHATISLTHADQGYKMYQGKCDISNGGVKDPNFYEFDPSKYTIKSTLAPYVEDEEKSDWEDYEGTLCLLIKIDNVINELDLTKYGTVSATIDGKEKTGCLHSTYNFGEGVVLLRLDLGEVAEGKHTVSVTVASDDLVLYETDDLEVLYDKETTGEKEKEPDKPSEPSDKPSDKTGDGVVVATVAMAIALAAMAVVVKKIKA